jgi:hypothetical protein
MVPGMSALDEQTGGDHYKKLGDYQPWIVAKNWLTPTELKGAAKMTAITYLCRENDKGGREDIKKAMHTLQIYLEITEPDTSVGDVSAKCTCDIGHPDYCLVHAS